MAARHIVSLRALILIQRDRQKYDAAFEKLSAQEGAQQQLEELRDAVANARASAPAHTDAPRQLNRAKIGSGAGVFGAAVSLLAASTRRTSVASTSESPSRSGSMAFLWTRIPHPHTHAKALSADTAPQRTR
eukprot:CAMPEP_0206246566 /NCGR_PEP_ID=MMETSP0047_2-20121206/19333_1 /ASSEMBLY_ACC=CAM_ASM_000192 /TAXON_ID=195065 /ORGANISM="Chroomonas mesostigmatica_cf, Strain CCMP1168" /LENGTH=131 /DNA_ID=CAMNT_0053672009 /DNA_START=155 /DNA_END=546 /DNA_ORIENTATION=-